MSLDGIVDVPFFHAPVEDLMLGLLRPLETVVPNLKIRSLIEGEKDFSLPYVLVRRETGAFASDSFGNSQDTRFAQRAVVVVDVFVADPDGDEKGAHLAEMVRARLYTCWRKQEIVEGVGHIAHLRMSSPPHRVPDWATATNVVQYANLPKGLHRYETTYGITVRPDETNRFDPLSLFTP